MSIGHMANKMVYLPPSEETRKYFPAREINAWGNISYTISQQDPPQDSQILIRVIHLHGNSDDITTTGPIVDDFQDWFHKYAPLPTTTVVMTVDYPTYSGNGDGSILGTSRLDDEIENIWQRFVAGYPNDGYKAAFNVIWSFSIGTHYACKLANRRPEIDFLLMTAPFDHLSTSAAPFWARFYTGPQGDGICCLKPREGIRIMAYLASEDAQLPIYKVIPLIKSKVQDMKIESGKEHNWFKSGLGVKATAKFLALAL